MFKLSALVFVLRCIYPFPVHGIDPIVENFELRIAICAFIYGITGLSLANINDVVHDGT